MSKSSTASAPKTSFPAAIQVCLARGPPQTASSSRSQSPAPSPVTANPPSNAHASHSRRPSALGQGVAIKDGVSVPRAVGSAKSSSAVTFGSIDDAQAPISSSPATAPAVKPADGVKSFGSVAVQNGASNKAAFTRPASLSQNASNASSVPSAPSPVPKIDKKDIMKMFQGPSVQAPPSDTASPSTRTSSLPQPPHSASGQSSYGAPPFTPRGQGQNGNVPRSPSFPRAMANGTSGGVNVGSRPSAGPGGPNGSMPAGMSSPRLAPHPHPNTAGMPPPPTPQMWPPYYGYQPYMTGGMPPEQYMAPQQYWGVPPQMAPHQHPHPPHPGPGGPPPPGGLPMSPRNPPPSLPLQAGPGTPQAAHAALPPPVHTPGPHHA
ncbi:hypothetical protein EVG20_g11711, partial [Dentipellis fragilis]